MPDTASYCCSVECSNNRHRVVDKEMSMINEEDYMVDVRTKLAISANELATRTLELAFNRSVDPVILKEINEPLTTAVQYVRNAIKTIDEKYPDIKLHPRYVP
jgi:hypothetical protein